MLSRRRTHRSGLKPMNNQNLIAAVILSVIILVGFQYLYVKPQQEHYTRSRCWPTKNGAADESGKAIRRNAPARDRATVIGEDPRIKISQLPNCRVRSISRARASTIFALRNYHETGSIRLRQQSSCFRLPARPRRIRLFRPISAGLPAIIPWRCLTASTQWKAEGDGNYRRISRSRSAGTTGAALYSSAQLPLDDHFMFTVTDDVRNSGAAPATLYLFRP